MTGSSFRYLVKEGARSVKANRMMSVASVLVLLTCMLLIGGAVLFSVNVDSILTHLEAENQIRVFLKPEIDAVDKANVDADLHALPAVATITYVSKEEAADFMRPKMGEASDLLDDATFLPEAYVLTLKDITQMDEVIGTVTQYAGVLQVRSTREMAETLVSARNMITLAGLVIVSLLIIVSLVITGNTIKLTVFNRRKEISIMKFVGATDGFIRLPFIIEGIILGLISALLAVLITWGYYTYVLGLYHDWATGFFGTLSASLIPFSVVAPGFALGFFAGGLVTGGMGSLLFVRRYLKV